MRAAAAEATAVGVCQSVAVRWRRRASRRGALADDAAAAALGASAAADAADGRLASRGAALASARAAADDARAFLGRGGRRVRGERAGNARETTFTLDADARVGRRLAAALGPASASPAFAKGVTPAFRLKPGLHVVLAVSGRGLSRDGEAPRRESAAPPTLAELVATAVPPARGRRRRRRGDARVRRRRRRGGVGGGRERVRCAVGCVTLRHTSGKCVFFSVPLRRGQGG